MFDPILASFPFVNRNQLAFENGTRFQLFVENYAAVTASIYIVGATKDGTFKYRVNTTQNNGRDTNTFDLPDLPIWVSVQDIDQSYAYGDLYVRVSLNINGDTMATLMGGYVNLSNPLSWPAINIEKIQPVTGSLTFVTGTNPAAGAEISESVPSANIWKVKAVKFALVTDATAVTRQVTLKIQRGSTAVMQISANASQAASLTRNYTFAPLSSPLTTQAGTVILGPLPPDLLLFDGDDIITVTENIQAGDDFGTPIIYVEKLLAI